VGGDPVDEHEKICSTEENALVSEIGHLSLNEEREVRFHGQASGLHLLDVKDRVDGRNEGGIWLVDGFLALLVHDFNEDSADSALTSQAFPQSSSLATFAGLRVWPSIARRRSRNLTRCRNTGAAPGNLLRICPPRSTHSSQKELPGGAVRHLSRYLSRCCSNLTLLF
jgi:hypothetical protein